MAPCLRVGGDHIRNADVGTALSDFALASDSNLTSAPKAAGGVQPCRPLGVCCAAPIRFAGSTSPWRGRVKRAERDGIYSPATRSPLRWRTTTTPDLLSGVAPSLSRRSAVSPRYRRGICRRRAPASLVRTEREMLKGVCPRLSMASSLAPLLARDSTPPLNP